MTDAGTPAVQLREVFCVHRTGQGDAAALQGLSLSVSAGERVCVLGPSGAGKTTMLRVIAGLQRPSAGVVRVFGVDVGRLSTRASARVRNASLGFLHQHAEAALSPDLPIGQAVALGLALRGVSRAIRERRARGLLAAAGLQERSDALPGALSGGERQRVAVCAAVAHRPRLLLADEPTAELDDVAAEAIAALIEWLADRDGVTVITVSHDPDLARRAGRILRIRDGRVVEDGSSLVVAPGGWVRLGDKRLRDAGIGERLRTESTPTGLLLTAAGRDGDGAPATPATTRARPPVPPVRLAVESVTRVRGGRAVLDALTLHFAPGRLTAVVGRSGAGKTTLLELLAGLAVPDAGAIRLDDDVLEGGAEHRAAVRRARIGYLPQEPVPVGFLSASENIALALTARGWERGQAARAAGAALERVGLAERSDQRIERLSAGEAQRVALARALACANGLLIVDEPTSRLDEETATAVADVLAAAAERDGNTVICATHDAPLIRRAHVVVTLGEEARRSAQLTSAHRSGTCRESSAPHHQ
jgi:peptide/nickel transport system ATP-binding protein/energy-coupling factor transport system ATP-binding protein